MIGVCTLANRELKIIWEVKNSCKIEHLHLLAIVLNNMHLQFFDLESTLVYFPVQVTGPDKSQSDEAQSGPRCGSKQSVCDQGLPAVSLFSWPPDPGESRRCHQDVILGGRIT